MKIREEKGIQIKLQKFSSWSDLTDALHTGKIDGASELIELAMSAKTKGVDLKAVALGHRDGNVIVTNSTIESFEARKGMSVFIPPYEVEAEVGFSVEYVHKHYGGFGPLADAIREGKILGVVNMVGCNNPKIMYEKAVLDVCDVLLKNNVLIITNGCASFPLMKMGYCQTSDFAYGKCGDGLREFYPRICRRYGTSANASTTPEAPVFSQELPQNSRKTSTKCHSPSPPRSGRTKKASTPHSASA